MPTTKDDTFFWLSFADETLPKGSQFLGATVVQGENLKQVVLTAHLLGINPGGEVVSMKFKRHEMQPDHLQFMWNKLRSWSEMVSQGIV